MAIVRNPLFSLAASGRVGDLLTFRMNEKRATARRWRSPSAPATAAQQAERLRASWAASQFHALEPIPRQRWDAYALAIGLPVFAAYMGEFCAQRCTLSTQPEIPAL